IVVKAQRREPERLGQRVGERYKALPPCRDVLTATLPLLPAGIQRLISRRSAPRLLQLRLLRANGEGLGLQLVLEHQLVPCDNAITDACHKRYR
ncbi:hypothetical protein, partial [Cronobacter sakazakii]|uniref:hypothetical protein n=1 Tax=Cronobacter sakazakii TaxID=28141 RepID=UPI001319F5CA